MMFLITLFVDLYVLGKSSYVSKNTRVILVRKSWGPNITYLYLCNVSMLSETWSIGQKLNVVYLYRWTNIKT